MEKSSSCLKRVKNSLERELNYQIIHSRGKVTPLKQMEQSALSIKKKKKKKKSITSFGAVKNPKFIILLIFVPISRVVVVVAIYTGVAKTFSANVGQILLPSKYALDLGAKLYRTRRVTINCCRYHTNEDFRSAMFIYCSH